MTRGDRAGRVPWAPILTVIGVAVLAVAGRRLGASEQASAASLAIGATAVLVVHAARHVHRGGFHRLATVAFASGVAIAASAPALRSITPGRPVLSAVLEREGSSVALPPGSAGAVRVLVSSELPETRKAYLGFTLAIGAERLEGSLEHGVRRWEAGEEVQRYHVHRSSMYLESRIEPGARELSLARLASSSPSPLRVDVHRPVIPSWALLLLSSAALVLAGVVEVRSRAPGQIAGATGAALAAGLLTGWSATPDHALWPVIGSLAVGAFVGVAAGLATSAAARRLHKAATRAVTRS